MAKIGDRCQRRAYTLARLDNLTAELQRIGLYMNDLHQNEVDAYRNALRPLMQWCRTMHNDKENDWEAMSKVTKPIGVTQHTSQMILLFLETVSRPARCSEIRKAICRRFPEAPVYGSLGELNTAGIVQRLTMERDALYTIGERK